MLRPATATALLPAGVLASACLLGNPAFDPASGAGSEATSAAASATTGTAPPTSVATTSVATGTGGPGPASTSLASGEDGTSRGSGSTGGATPGIRELAPEIATCVFVKTGDDPHGPPAECSANADKQNGTDLTGLMMIDISVTLEGGLGRPARSYMRFDVPADIAGLTVAAARLHVRVADGPPPLLPQSGALVLTGPFDDVTLLTDAPPLMLPPLVEDMGEVMPSQWLVWELPTDLIVPDKPLFLGLVAKDDMGVELCGKTSPDAPILELDLQ